MDVRMGRMRLVPMVLAAFWFGAGCEAEPQGQGGPSGPADAAGLEDAGNSGSQLAADPADDTPAVDAPPVASCGNGLLDPGEKCDPASAAHRCPATAADCAGGGACTEPVLIGGACNVLCQYVPSKKLAAGDGCCPAGASQAQDADCQAVCGNGVLEGGEECDLGIASGPGSCAEPCDDGNACTQGARKGIGCAAACAYEPVVLAGADGCCPEGLTFDEDPDCSPTCGNGSLDPGELCDTAILGGAGACPASCDDGDPCMKDQLIGAGTCGAACVHAPVVAAVSGDGCCASGANANTDSDCGPACGNGAVEAGEACDIGIAGGPGACPESGAACDDDDPCTTDQLSGAGTCEAACQHSAPMAPSGDVADGCCPPWASKGTDADCVSVCGNGLLEAGEACDTAVPAGGPGACPSAEQCDDGDPCTQGSVALAQPDNGCSALCVYAPVPGCCGNGIVEPQVGELCDKGLPQGSPGACPATCAPPDGCTTATLVAGGTCQAQCAHQGKPLSAEKWYYTPFFYTTGVAPKRYLDFEVLGDLETPVFSTDDVPKAEYEECCGIRVTYVGEDITGHLVWWGTPQTGHALRVDCNNYGACHPPTEHGIRIDFTEPVTTVGAVFPATTIARFFDTSGKLIAMKEAGGKGDSFLGFASPVAIGTVIYSDVGGESVKDLWYTTCGDAFPPGP